jgi:hypothetical protein
VEPGLDVRKFDSCRGHFPDSALDAASRGTALSDETRTARSVYYERSLRQRVEAFGCLLNGWLTLVVVIAGAGWGLTNPFTRSRAG